MTEIIVTKRCSYCKQIKLLSEFYKQKNTRGGNQCYCRLCQSKYNKKYQQTEQGKAAKNKGSKRYRLKYPKRRKAKDAVSAAVKNGKLPKINTLHCFRCFAQAEQYHHPSYAKKH